MLMSLPEPPAPLRVRSLFLSDIHLGTRACRANDLLSLLRDYDAENIFLVGDIIDGWQLKQRWFWPQSHNDVIQKILRKARKGCKVTFVAGNHDEFARLFSGHQFGGIDIVRQSDHLLKDGRKMWVIHGDYFDAVIQRAKWLAVLGDHAYEFILKINLYFNGCRAKLGLPYWSLSAYLKHKVKQAVSYISHFEQAVATEARKRGDQVVVCGHIHHANISYFDNIHYINCGDWVESCTAIVEHHNGKFEIIRK